MSNLNTTARASLRRNIAGETVVGLDLKQDDIVVAYDLDLVEAEALIFELFTATDTWRGIVRPSKPLTRVDLVLRRLGLRRS